MGLQLAGDFDLCVFVFFLFDFDVFGLFFWRLFVCVRVFLPFCWNGFYVFFLLFNDSLDSGMNILCIIKCNLDFFSLRP